MKFFLPVLFTLMSLAFNAPANEADATDARISLGFTESEKAAFLSEMRQMLVSIQGVISGIGTNDRDLIVRSARYSGNRMARETPIAIKKKTPPEFKELGAPTHMMFEELVVRAEEDDPESLTAFTGELMKQCIACHAMFRAD
ncbi:MAG: cytochrome c [Gammaproteobacteria bacterium]|nr:cytochrome c [Gammaproteobacteria bacterium]